MARRSFRDRFFTPPVARAMTSPLGILLAGAGAAIGIVAIGPIGAVLGVAAWGARVLVAVPKDPRADRIDPFTLNEPWRRAVQDALQAQNRFREAISDARPGPMRDRMDEIAERVAFGVNEAWRVARQGQSLVAARRRIDTTEATQELAEMESRAADPASAGSSVEQTMASVKAELAAANRMDASIAEARDRLRLTNARLDEAVARVVELSVAADDVGDLAGLGDDVEALVHD
nr:hypothetical protein [Actinomycetota bacterium]